MNFLESHVRSHHQNFLEIRIIIPDDFVYIFIVDFMLMDLNSVLLLDRKL